MNHSTNTNHQNTNNNQENTENIFTKLKTIPIAISVAVIYVILIIITLVLLYNQGSSTTTNSNSNNSSSDNSSDNSSLGFTIFATITFVLLLLACIIILLPNFKEIKDFLGQIQTVLYVILYTIFLILFFRLIPSDTLNSYAFIFTPLTLMGVFYFFYNALKTNYITKFNVNYERIKMIMLFFSFITTMVIYYSVDPGGYIQKNLGYSMFLSILLAIFSFLYLIIVLTLQTKTPMKGGSGFNFDFSHFNPYIWFINIAIIVFIVLLGLGINHFPGGFLSNIGISTAVIIFTMLILIIWGCILAVTYYPDITNKVLDDTKMNLFKKSMLLILGIVISGLIIAWLSSTIQNYTGGETSTVSLLLNIILAVVLLTFIYKIINVKQPAGSKPNTFIELVKSILFYIPCLFSDLFDSVMQFFIKEYNTTKASDFYYLLFTILVIFVYLIFMMMKGNFFLQGGKQLINQPINTDTMHNIATYHDLNGTSSSTSNTDENFNYQYGLSFWLFIDSMPPNNNPSYTKYTSLLNYGNKPNILYKADTNTLLVTMDSGRVFNLSRDLTYTNNNQTNDDNKNIIVYKKENYLLQKWNQIIINYNGGTLDIFMNGELVKTVVGIVPYMYLDALTVGTNDGIQGGVCNLLYFKKPLTATNIYYLYNTVKNKKLPTS
jgi:hypothetical protein